MNYLERKKSIFIKSQNSEVKQVLTEDFVFKAVTTFSYCEGQQEASYSYPKTISTTGDNGFLQFEIDNILIKFPIEVKMYSYNESSVYSKFMYKNGKWGLNLLYSSVVYDGTEEWFQSANCTYAIKNPEDMVSVPYNTQYTWMTSNITNKNTSYATVYKYENAIGGGTENTAIHINDTVTDVEQFKEILRQLKENGTPFTVIYELEDPKWIELSEDIQKYLRRYM